MSVVDEFPFPFAKPEGQELLRVMAAFYRTEREALLFAQPFGVDPLEVPSGLSAINLWVELLQALAARNTVRAAVEATRRQFPNNPRGAFLDALLKNRPTTVSAEPSAQPGPAFDDSVSEPEALLFFDDLTMPVGRVPNLISTLCKMVAIAPAVCLLRVETLAGSFFGTGFRISDRLVLTNHHVLYPRDQIAIQVQADFGFDVNSTGASTQVTSLQGVTSTIVGEKADDWAVVEIPGMASEWPVLPLDAGSVPRVGDAAYILQHPGGQHKRLGFVRNTISHVGEDVVRYLTDTAPGSSGAPVFDAEGRPIALHHAGGRPVEVAGKPPVAKNEGIRITRVLDRLKATGALERSHA